MAEYLAIMIGLEVMVLKKTCCGILSYIHVISLGKFVSEISFYKVLHYPKLCITDEVLQPYCQGGSYIIYSGLQNYSSA